MKALTRRVMVAGVALATQASAAATHGAVSRRPWGRLADGRAVSLYTLKNRHGLTARISDFGAVLVSLRTPDRRGRMGDIVLGYDSVERYLDDTSMLGAVVGRYANRIGGGHFVLDGRGYQLARNLAGANIHGGPNGWYKALWEAKALAATAGPTLVLSHVSPDADQGFPGAVGVTFTYQLTHDNRLRMAASARTTAPTVINMTHHSYFNLAADPARDVFDTVVQIAADAYTPADALDLPTGEIRTVAGGVYDFREPHPIGRDLPPTGYNQNYVLDETARQEKRRAAFAHDPRSGRTLELWTDQPGLQFYTAHWLNTVGKGGVAYKPGCAFCFEAQHFPDSPNQPSFPTTVLRPGETFAWRADLRLGLG